MNDGLKEIQKRINDLKNARDNIDFTSWVFHKIEEECGSTLMDNFEEQDIGKFTRVPIKSKRIVMKQLVSKKIKEIEYNKRFLINY